MNIKQKLVFVALFTYLIIGIILSINTGISHDEFHEQLNWDNNFEAFKSLFGLGDYKKLTDYIDKYHGVAFQFISQPIQLLFHNIVSELTGANQQSSYLLTKHVVVFISYFFSGLYFYRISKLISSSKTFGIVTATLYFTFPYLFGHSLINPKDIPFLVFWLISTFYFFKILKKLYLNESPFLLDIIKLSIFTAFLISIRIVGILIFIEFLVGIIILFNYKNLIFFNFLKLNHKHILIFFTIFLLCLFFLNPIFWKNPLEIINSIKNMSKFYNDVCTLTLGKCERSLNLPAKYYFIWLFFKLPIMSLLGIIIYPLIEKKFLKGNFATIILLSLLITVISIIFLFILVKVAIYDEIRHIMFLIPLILIISFYNIYLLNKKIFYLFSFLTIIFFNLNNLKLYPYQYSWLNYIAQFYNINKTFEVDYWGVSNKNLQLNILKFYKKNKFKNDICVYGDGYASAFLENKNFRCFGNYIKIDSINERPFIAYQNLRNLKRNDPNNCYLLKEENYNYLFTSQKIITGKIWYCN